MTLRQRIKRALNGETLGSKIIITFIMSGISIFFVGYFAMNTSMEKLLAYLVEDQLEARLDVLTEYMDNGDWSVRDGTLYCGSMKLGDGTEANANAEPFLAMACSEDDPVYGFAGILEDDGTFIRVAGTTRDSKGKALIGTSLDADTTEMLHNNEYFLKKTKEYGKEYYSYFENIRNRSGEVVGFIVAARDVSSIQKQLAMAKQLFLVALILILIFSEITLLVRTKTWVDAIRRIQEYLGRMGTGTFPEEPLMIDTGDEIAVVADSINEMKDSLIQNQRRAGELEVATNIQKNMLHRDFPLYPDRNEFQVYANMEAAREVGGDLYDMFMPDDKHLAILVADVSGKGVPAAMIMAITKTIIKNYAEYSLDPATVLTNVNNQLTVNNEESFFVTAWLGILDVDTGEMQYANAGHNPPAFCTAGGNHELLKMRPGFVLGGMEGIKYKKGSIQMKPGDRILLYTDGVTEAQNRAEEFYGEGRLLEYLDNNKEASSYDIVDGLLDDLKTFSQGREQFDDITILSMHYRGPSDKLELEERCYDANLEEFENANAFIEGLLEEAGVSMKVSMAIQVAFEEMFVNVAKYAYTGREQGSVYVAAGYENNKFVIRLKDSGKPFNPLEKEDADITLSAEEREIGGLGIYMVRQTMDRVSYQYVDGMNIFEMMKEF